MIIFFIIAVNIAAFLAYDAFYLSDMRHRIGIHIIFTLIILIFWKLPHKKYIEYQGALWEINKLSPILRCIKCKTTTQISEMDHGTFMCKKCFKIIKFTDHDGAPIGIEIVKNMVRNKILGILK